MVDAWNLSVLQGYDYEIMSFGSVDNSYNLLTPQPGEKATLTMDYESGGTYFAGFYIDLGSSKPVDQIGLLYNSCKAAACEWDIFVAEDPEVVTGSYFGGIPMVDSGGFGRPEGYRHGFWNGIGLGAVGRYVRIVVASPDPTPFNVGNFIVGKALQLENNADYGETSWGYEEADDGEFLDSGVEILESYEPVPVLNFTATWVSQAEMDAGWEELGRLQHLGVPVLVSRRPDPHAGRHNGLYYGRLKMVPIVAAEFDMFEVQGRIRSMV